ncbi:flagellar hook-associated protein FlgL [Agrilutibacter solisilvae]|uniref:Flagellar hook-associated protein FlgL n=1 Tax=Agrilutibacter solisilvae TaxID=2763317 RepID=A0A975AS20_9GAMM|nr:flagellar hook-associated protein FlgL [Lysobacter solisilvae]QSX77619.1 flagellar hook-associated protein FlgL [Lysobacter solisilvae]
MTLRISTAALYQQGLQGLLKRQDDVARAQRQLVTGNKLERAADDPSGMAQAQRLDHAVARLEQFGANAGLLENRLRSQEQALSEVNDKLVRARELAIQANSPVLSAADRKSIANDLRAIRADLLGIANRDDGTGRRLFAGNRDGVVPFTESAGSVVYAGDDGRNQVEVAPDLSLQDTDPGSDVFLRVRTGDGLVRGSAAASNAGNGVLQATSVSDPTAWAGRRLTVEFTAPDAYRVLDDTGATIATGTYAAPTSSASTTISSAGVQLTLTGAPAANDRFTVERAPVRDVFATLQGLADALDAPAVTPSGMAQRDNAVGAAISDLGTAQDHMLAVRSSTGIRLASLDTASDVREGTDISLAQSLSHLRDVDYAEAASRLTLQLTALEAAQKTMLRIQGNSLFDKLG